MVALRLALVFVGAATVGGCEPTTCDPKPLPEDFKLAEELLPPSAVVCGTDEKGRLELTFKEKSPNRVALDVLALFEKSGWKIESDNIAPDHGSVAARRDGKRLSFSVVNPKGGPNAGKVIGTFHLSTVEERTK